MFGATFLGRWVRFNLVGVLGAGVQLLVLTLATTSGWHYLPATLVAVEAAVIHNFCWHERWTWSIQRGSGSHWRRWLEFQGTVGLLSLLSNLFLMRLLVGTLQLPVLVANGLAVVTLACVNFLISDRLVFVQGSGR